MQPSILSEDKTGSDFGVKRLYRQLLDFSYQEKEITETQNP